MIKELMALRYLEEFRKQVEPKKWVGHPIMALDLNQMMMKMSTRMILRRISTWVKMIVQLSMPKPSKSMGKPKRYFHLKIHLNSEVQSQKPSNLTLWQDSREIKEEITVTKWHQWQIRHLYLVLNPSLESKSNLDEAQTIITITHQILTSLTIWVRWSFNLVDRRIRSRKRSRWMAIP